MPVTSKGRRCCIRQRHGVLAHWLPTYQRCLYRLHIRPIPRLRASARYTTVLRCRFNTSMRSTFGCVWIVHAAAVGSYTLRFSYLTAGDIPAAHRCIHSTVLQFSYAPAYQHARICLLAGALWFTLQFMRNTWTTRGAKLAPSADRRAAAPARHHSGSLVLNA